MPIQETKYSSLLEDMNKRLAKPKSDSGIDIDWNTKHQVNKYILLMRKRGNRLVVASKAILLFVCCLPLGKFGENGETFSIAACLVRRRSRNSGESLNSFEFEF